MGSDYYLPTHKPPANLYSHNDEYDNLPSLTNPFKLLNYAKTHLNQPKNKLKMNRGVTGSPTHLTVVVPLRVVLAGVATPSHP